MGDTAVENVLRLIFSKTAEEEPCDQSDPNNIDIDVPEWFDENKYEQGRRLFWDNAMVLMISMSLGVIPIFSMPNAIRIVVSTHRSGGLYAAFQRYTATLLHVVAWFEHKLKPGSESWKSLVTVRCRHYRASQAGKLKGAGIVSQRELAISIYGFVGYVLLKPEKFGLKHVKEEDWEAYNHLWRFLGHVVGLRDEYNICRHTVSETRRLCQILQDRVFTPCLETVPEYFEHITRMYARAMALSLPIVNGDAVLYQCKHLSDVPGYVYTESERMELQNVLREKLELKSLDTGIEAATLMSQPAVKLDSSPTTRMLYLRDFESGNVPAYTQLPFPARLSLNTVFFILNLNSTRFGRLFLNTYLKVMLIFVKYLPLLAMYQFGFYKSYVDMYKDTPRDYGPLKTNAEYWDARKAGGGRQSKSYVTLIHQSILMTISVVISLLFLSFSI